MQMVKKSVLVLVAIWLALVILMPKQEIYYKLEEALDSYEIRLNEEKKSEGFFSLNLKGVSVYVKGINVATIEELNLFTLLFYSSVELRSLLVDDSLKTMIPQETTSAVLRHSILSPLDASVSASGSFGSLTGNIDLNERRVHLDFNESENIQMLKPAVKKSEKGWVYETSF